MEILKVDLSVMLPSYNEKDNLEVLLPRIIEELKKLKIKYQIIVIDTLLAMDDTEKLCESLGVYYYKREYDNTYGSAIKTGIKKCKGNKIIIMDADGSHDTKYLKELYEASNKFDLVIGSRYVKYGKTENNFILIFMSQVVNIVYRLFLKIKVKDVSNSFRIYDAKQLKELKLECNEFDLVEEMLIKLKINNPKIKIKEIPIEFKKRIHGKSKRKLLKFFFLYIFTLKKLRSIR